MSRSTVPFVFGLGLALAANAAPARAQGGAAIVRSIQRRPANDSLTARMRQLEQSIDSLVRSFGDDELSPEQRLRLRNEIDSRVGEFSRLRAADERSREGNVFIRVPGPDVDPRTRALRMAMTPPLSTAMAPGWIGIVVTGAPTELRVENNEVHMRYLLYPVIASVDPSSPAQRAGITPGDTLIAYNGRDVRREEISMTRLLRPKSTVNVRVRRDGRLKEVPVLVAEAPARIRLRRDEEMRDGMAPMLAMPDRPVGPSTARTPFAFPREPLPPPSPAGTVGPQRVMTPLGPPFEFAPNGVAGAQMVTVSEAMKRSLRLPAGVLVTTVPVGSPAEESGLQEGDVIVAVGQQAVKVVHELREAVARASEVGDRSVPLEIRRGKERRSLSLRW